MYIVSFPFLKIGILNDSVSKWYDSASSQPQLVYVLSRQLGCQRASASWQRRCWYLYLAVRVLPKCQLLHIRHHNMYNFFDKRGVLTKTISLITLSANDYRTSQVQILNLAGAPWRLTSEEDIVNPDPARQAHIFGFNVTTSCWQRYWCRYVG